MKKYYCDHCGKEIDNKHTTRLGLVRPDESVLSGDTFHLCDTCRDAFYGWMKGTPAEQEKPHKIAEQPEAKPSKKDNKTKKPFTVSNIAFLSSAPESTVRRHLEGICSTYGKDENGRTIRYYHMTDEQLNMVVDRIKNRQQGRRNKI